MSMYAEFIKDFATRTLENLKYIEQANANGEHVFEITQLINSFLGLIVFPQEKDEERVFEISVDPQTIERVYSGRKRNTYKGERKEENLKNLIYHFRNAISHGHIEASMNKENEICKLSFRDVNPRNQDETFQIDIKVPVLRAFVLEFSESLIRSYGG